jgi:hypothetical protein
MAVNGPKVPDELLMLVPVASTLVTVATNPVQFLRGPVLEIVLEALILRPTAWVLEYLLEGFAIVTGAVSDVGEILSDPIIIVRDAFLSAVNGAYAVLYGSLTGLGLAAPVATVATVAVFVVVLVTVLYAAASVIPGSDALGVVSRWT